MPFQPINFRLNQSSPLSDLAQGLMRGLQFRQQMESRGLQDQLAQKQIDRESLQKSILDRQSDPTQQADFLKKSYESGVDQFKGMPNEEALKSAFFRKTYGLPEMLPGEKLEQEQYKTQAKLLGDMQLANYKMNLALEQKKREGQLPSPAIVAANQKTIQSVVNLMPTVQKLQKMDVPSQALVGAVRWGQENRDLQAEYKKDINLMAEGMLSAFGINQTEKGIETMVEVLQRKVGESLEGYRNRLSQIEEDLLERQENAQNINSKQVSFQDLVNTVKKDVKKRKREREKERIKKEANVKGSQVPAGDISGKTYDVTEGAIY